MDDKKISRLKVDDMVKALAEFRAIKKSFNVNEMMVFLTVALYEGASIRELAKKVGLPPVSVSRHAINLSSKGTKMSKSSGVGLVHRYDDPAWELVTRVELTDKGRELLERIAGK